MDSGTEDYLQNLLPEPVVTLLRDHVLRSDAPLHLWARALAGQAARGADAWKPYAASASDSLTSMATPVLDRVARAAYNAPDAVVLAAVLVALLLVLQILALLRRLVAWWTRIALRLLFWAGVGLLLAAVWQRGPEQVIADAAALVGRIVAFAAFVGDIWRSEYDKYQLQQAQAAAAYRPHAQPRPGFSTR